MYFRVCGSVRWTLADKRLSRMQMARSNKNSPIELKLELCVDSHELKRSKLKFDLTNWKMEINIKQRLELEHIKL